MTPGSRADGASSEPAARAPGSSGETSRFGRNAAIYVVLSVLVRGITVILTPLYTRAMAPSDFAIVAVANSVAAVLGVAFGLCLHGCVIRLSLEYDDAHRPAFFGTLLALTTTLPLLGVALLYALGETGHLEIFESLHFAPHLELVIWASYFSVFVPLPLAVYTAREQPTKASLLGGASALAQLVLTVVFVVGLRQGAVGVLRANLASAVLTGVLSFALMARLSRLTVPLPGAVRALAFSLPLVPHLVANWALAVSDRLVLDRYVPAADVGRYALAYLFNLLLSVVGSAIGNALGPMAYRLLKDPERAREVPPLGTYAVLCVVILALGSALTAGEVVALVAPPSYRQAVVLVPWVVLGGLFQGLYQVLSIGTWFSMRTSAVSLVTATSAAVNIGFNLIFVPRYGVAAAAVSTALAYGVSAVLHGILAHALHPIPWEYRRWAMVGLAGLGWYALGERLPLHGLFLPLAAKTTIAAVAFPATLLACGFFSAAERARMRSWVSQRLAARR